MGHVERAQVVLERREGYVIPDFPPFPHSPGDRGVWARRKGFWPLFPPPAVGLMAPAEFSAGEGDGAAVLMEEDAFLGFVDYAMSELSPEEERGSSRDCGSGGDRGGGGDERRGPSWSWVVSRILKTCLVYSSGVTPAIILSELFQVSAVFSLTLHPLLSENFAQTGTSKIIFSLASAFVEGLWGNYAVGEDDFPQAKYMFQNLCFLIDSCMVMQFLNKASIYSL